MYFSVDVTYTNTLYMCPIDTDTAYQGGHGPSKMAAMYTFIIYNIYYNEKNQTVVNVVQSCNFLWMNAHAFD